MIRIFYELILAHAFFDLAAQSQYISYYKNPLNVHPHGTYWPFVLVGHGLINGLGVYIVTGKISLSILETICHAIIDFGSCLRWYPIFVDQGLHLMCKILWTVIYTKCDTLS